MEYNIVKQGTHPSTQVGNWGSHDDAQSGQVVASVDMPCELKAMLYNMLLVVEEMCFLIRMLLKRCVGVHFDENMC